MLYLKYIEKSLLLLTSTGSLSTGQTQKSSNKTSSRAREREREREKGKIKWGWGKGTRNGQTSWVKKYVLKFTVNTKKHQMWHFVCLISAFLSLSLSLSLPLLFVRSVFRFPFCGAFLLPKKHHKLTFSFLSFSLSLILYLLMLSLVQNPGRLLLWKIHYWLKIYRFKCLGFGLELKIFFSFFVCYSMMLSNTFIFTLV